ncbi:MAG: class I SAM-dependent methyltransferase [Nocardiaceae bacterium]|nr:class I SAM-dependent methyltransferase [Nocardiaceae bacterium]
MNDDPARFVGDVPGSYDRGLGPVMFEWYAQEVARRVAKTKPRTVLETAAGTGIVSRALRDAIPHDSTLTITDLNAPMLEIARAKFAPGESVSIEVADAQHLAYRDKSFESMVCQFGVMFFPDQLASFQQARRVLLPGGEYHLSVWDSHAHNGFARIAHEGVRQLFPDDPPPYFHTPFKDSAIAPMTDLFERAGFDEIDVDVVPHQSRVERWESFVDGLVFGSPLKSQIDARGTHTAEEVHGLIVEGLIAEYGPAPSTLPMQAILYRAIAS